MALIEHVICVYLIINHEIILLYLVIHHLLLLDWSLVDAQTRSVLILTFFFNGLKIRPHIIYMRLQVKRIILIRLIKVRLLLLCVSFGSIMHAMQRLHWGVTTFKLLCLKLSQQLDQEESKLDRVRFLIIKFTFYILCLLSSTHKLGNEMIW